MPGLATQIQAEVIDAAPPNVAHTLLARAKTLVGSGRAEAARPLLAAVRSLGGDANEADALEAQLLIQAGHAAEARAILDVALDRAPANVALRLLRAEARMLGRDSDGAAKDAAEAVIAEPHNAGAKAALGITLIELGCFSEAIRCLAEALRADSAHSGFRLVLARALDLGGAPQAAEAILREGIALAPRSVSLRTAAIKLAIAQKQFTGAIAMAEAARTAGAVDAVIFGLWGQALATLGEDEAAGEAFAEALKLAPEDAYFRHMTAASGRLPAPPQATEGFLRRLFDEQAGRFDHHLIGLNYRVPGLLREAAKAHLTLPAAGRLGPVLDLGCGTGFVPLAMLDLPLGSWHGVDLSAPMLEQARTKGLYEQLQEASLLDALEQAGPDYALVTAADVFCYIGQLAPVLAAIYRRLSPGGCLLASVESLPRGQGWRLGPLGRYRHAPDHVAQMAEAAGFAVRAITPNVIRTERGAPVDGLIVVLGKPLP